MEINAMDIIKLMKDDIKSAPSKPTLMIKMPAYNEERKISVTVSGVNPYADVDVMDYGSKDKTVELSEKARTMFIHHKVNIMSEKD